MNPIPFIDSAFMEMHCKYPVLIESLKKGFAAGKPIFPKRNHYQLGIDPPDVENTLLIMPAWDKEKDLGIKLVTIYPENRKQDKPVIQGVYVHFDKITGTPSCLLDARTLTNIRTAATSVLAASYLARPQSTALLMIGTGTLCPYFIKAYTSLFPIEKVYLWGRDYIKTRKRAEELTSDQYEVIAVKSYREVVAEADIISTITLSREPLVLGQDVRPGQHIDLVGSYTPDRREADDEVIMRSRIYVDTMEGACTESGDLVIPLTKGIIRVEDIAGDLFSLCSQTVAGRRSMEEITLFKSVGYALEDLVAARYFLNLKKG